MALPQGDLLRHKCAEEPPTTQSAANRLVVDRAGRLKQDIGNQPNPPRGNKIRDGFMVGSLTSKSRTAEAILFLSISKFLIEFVQLKHWVKFLGQQGSSSDEASDMGYRYARYVDHAAKFLPFEVICLPRAMALSLMLRRRSIPHTLVIAARPIARRTEGGRLHAWIECAGKTVIGEIPGPWIQVFRTGELRSAGK